MYSGSGYFVPPRGRGILAPEDRGDFLAQRAKALGVGSPLGGQLQPPQFQTAPAGIQTPAMQGIQPSGFPAPQATMRSYEGGQMPAPPQYAQAPAALPPPPPPRPPAAQQLSQPLPKPAPPPPAAPPPPSPPPAAPAAQPQAAPTPQPAAPPPQAPAPAPAPTSQPAAPAQAAEPVAAPPPQDRASANAAAAADPATQQMQLAQSQRAAAQQRLGGAPTSINTAAGGFQAAPPVAAPVTPQAGPPPGAQPPALPQLPQQLQQSAAGGQGTTLDPAAALRQRAQQARAQPTPAAASLGGQARVPLGLMNTTATGMPPGAQSTIAKGPAVAASIRQQAAAAKAPKVPTKEAIGRRQMDSQASSSAIGRSKPPVKKQSESSPQIVNQRSTYTAAKTPAASASSPKPASSNSRSESVSKADALRQRAAAARKKR